jgi:hypothetical protein
MVRPGMAGYPQAVGCRLTYGHEGRHQGADCSWLRGPEDFTPEGGYSVGG